MKNFGMMVKMMVMALAMGALFCSCNSAGGYDAYEAQESRASEGAQFIWYVNGMFQEGETESVYELSCAYPGVYDVTCIAYSADGALVKSASMAVTVYPR